MANLTTKIDNIYGISANCLSLPYNIDKLDQLSCSVYVMEAKNTLPMIKLLNRYRFVNLYARICSNFYE